MLGLSRISRDRLPHCGHHKPTATRSPGSANVPYPRTATARNLGTLAAHTTVFQHRLTSVGTTGISLTKPETAPHNAPASREASANRGTTATGQYPASNRKTPPAAANGGQRLQHQLRPPLHHGSHIKTAVSCRHLVQPVRLSTQAPAGTQ